MSLGRDGGITVLRSVGCLLISSWTSLAWDTTLTERLGQGLGLSQGHSLAWDQLSGSTPGSAASRGAAGGGGQQVLLLFLHCLLFHEPHSHQIHFSLAHQEVSILGDCGGQHRGAEDLKLTVCGSNPLFVFFLRTAQFVVCLFIHFQYKMPGLSLSHGPVSLARTSVALEACLLLQLPPGPSSRAVHGRELLPCFLRLPKDDSLLLNGAESLCKPVAKHSHSCFPGAPFPGAWCPAWCRSFPPPGTLPLCDLVSLIAEWHTAHVCRVHGALTPLASAVPQLLPPLGLAHESGFKTNPALCCGS
ncbi:hypothetical protein EK904_002064 [Melospiza melodia maxima]|nr:hypothetical protein EK904_002064 [Melospiza melodia maxima]